MARAVSIKLQSTSQPAEAKKNYGEGQDIFQRAFSACMDARDYSVK